jgi:hypothetical protein
LGVNSWSQATSASDQDPVVVLRDQNNRVLSGRLKKILEFRFQNISKCSVATKENLVDQYNQLPIYSDKNSEVIQALSLYLQSYRVSEPCLTALNKGEEKFQKWERRKFAGVTWIPSKVLTELDPHCVSLQVPNESGVYDSFPCLAGDYLIGKALINRDTWTHFILRNQSFLSRFREKLSSIDRLHSSVDLWELFRDSAADTPELREAFLAELNFYFTSFHSASSYIRGFHDHIWRTVLFATGSASETLEYFQSSRLIVDEFRGLYSWGEKQHIDMRVGSIQMLGKNRHNYMAAYLACHYRERNRLFHESLPVMLGYLYETYDFKSHMLNDKIGLSASVENFSTDTDRYRTGVYWGYRFCL